MYRSIRGGRSLLQRSYHTPSAVNSAAQRSSVKKPFYITTPIFYVNAAPHIGHFYTLVLSDCIKRWNAFIDPKRPTYFTTGTDEHGLKVQQAADKAGLPPREYVDLASQAFKELATVAKSSHDRFIRTTDDDNITASQELWKLLQQKGYIYKGKHAGWYCVSDETFYPETQVEKQSDGSMVSKETGKAVEWTSEENYFFALSRLRDPLLQFYRENKNFVVPEAKFREVEREVDLLGLQDLSVSRPVSRNSWGVPVPNDESQIMYVWFDALANYLTAAGFPYTTPQEFESSCFPPDVQVIGKDIVRFHAVYWPAFLLAVELPPPKQLVVHSHWTMGGAKMSKSVGNVVDPVNLIEAFGADTVKFFLLNDGYIDHDTVYETGRVVARHNTELVNKYGNLVMRVCGKKFDISRSLSVDPRVHLGATSEELVTRFTLLVSDTNTLVQRMSEHMREFQTARALAEVWNLISFANRFVQDAAPWSSHLKPEEQDAVIQAAAEVARAASIALQPFIPELATAMLDRLAVDKEKRGVEYVRYGADQTYGVGANRKGDYPVLAIEGY